MPKPDVYVIDDTLTGLYLKDYSINLGNCNWAGVVDSLEFASQAACDAAITAWGETPGVRFRGGIRPNLQPPH